MPIIRQTYPLKTAIFCFKLHISLTTRYQNLANGMIILPKAKNDIIRNAKIVKLGKQPGIVFSNGIY